MDNGNPMPVGNTKLINRTRLGVNAVVVAFFAAAAVVSIGAINSPSYWFPAFVAVSGTLAAAGTLIADLVRLARGRSLTEQEILDVGATVTSDAAVGESGDNGLRTRRRVFAWAAWAAALPALSLLIPFFYAALLWLFIVLKLQARRSWLFSVVAVVCFGILFNVGIVLLDLSMPPPFWFGR